MMAMEVNHSLVDKDFDRYVLAANGIAKHAIPLPVAALMPLDAEQSLLKAKRISRLNYNALTVDPFLCQSLAANVAYFVNGEYQLMQIIDCKINGAKLTKICNFPILTTRLENVSIHVAGKGMIVYSDGQGSLYYVKADSIASEAKWQIVYECQPLGVVPLLLLNAVYDEENHKIYAVGAECVSTNEANELFRLHIFQVSSQMALKSENKVDTSSLEFEHKVTGLAEVSELPINILCNKTDMVFLVKGECHLLAPAKDRSFESLDVFNKSMPIQRRQEKEGVNDPDMNMLYSMFPRAGIGYHGENVRPTKTSELASLDLKIPLRDRFQKSSSSLSSFYTPHEGSSNFIKSNDHERSNSPQNQPLKVPTTDTLLGGFEECDSGDPDAKAHLLLVNLSSEAVVQQQRAINCREFQFLCPGAHVLDIPSTLLFRNDVHGLMYELKIASNQVVLNHVATFPAFGFVQASKQDTKLMSFHPAGSFACIGEFTRRIFIYQNDDLETENKAHTCKQHIVEFGNQELLGLQITNNDTLLVLTPTTMYSLRLLLC
ncbi:hypothetical protein CCR75_006344 [Bremia lactucae]|uniref:Uncharacterized protein n=1 Tax=Bremia lactucae TaxID=4779 RepID=A0A976ILY4_BRELC|nr:hypothetical protein CCR75_006344 [Bremia lactucae]